MDSTLRNGTVAKSERVGIWMWVVIGAVLAVWANVAAAMRIIEVIPNENVRVYGEFSSTVVDAPIGPDGAGVPVEMTSAWLTVPALQPVAVVIIVIQQIILALATTVFIACLVALAWGVLRGVVFSRWNTAFVAIAGGSAAVGYFGYTFFGNMAANAAFARLSDYTYDNVILSADLSVLFLGAFVTVLAITVFAVGDRLQRETEGLV